MSGYSEKYLYITTQYISDLNLLVYAFLRFCLRCLCARVHSNYSVENYKLCVGVVLTCTKKNDSFVKNDFFY